MRHSLFLPLSLIAVFVSEIGYIQAADDKTDIPGMIWETTIQDPKFEYELKGADISQESQKIFLILGLRQKGKSDGPQDIKLQVVDVSGKLQANIDLNAYIQPKDVQQSRTNIGGVSVASNGVIFLALAQTNGQVRFVGVDVATNRSVVNNLLEFGYSRISVYKILQTKSGTLLLIGSANGQGFTAEVNQAGKVLWHKTIDGQVNMLFDAIEVTKGFVVVGGRRGENALAEIWAGEVNLKGDVVQSRSFPGPSRTVSIVQSSHNNYLIVFDKLDDDPKSENVQVVVQGLNSNFNPTWKQTIVSNTPITAPFHIASNESGGLIVAGVKDKGSLSLSHIHEDGNLAWTYSTTAIPPDYPRFNGAEILHVGKDFILASRLSTVNGREQQQIVKLTRFAINPTKK